MSPIMKNRFFHKLPEKTASGRYNPYSNKWDWENQKWTFCTVCNLYHGNRHIPDTFWNRKWKKKTKTAGVILTRKVGKEKEFFFVQCYHNLFSFPKGTVEHGETFKQAASRELMEETGIIDNLCRCKEFRHSIGDKMITFFLLEVDSNVQPFPPQDTPEITSWGWVKENKIDSLSINQITKNILKMYYKYK